MKAPQRRRVPGPPDWAPPLAAWRMRGRRIALINTTPSQPIGFYWRATQAPARGRLIAFPLLAVAEGMANEVSERVQAAPNEFEAMYGELIREQRRVAKVHWAIVVTGARRVCGVKAGGIGCGAGERADRRDLSGWRPGPGG